MNPKYPVYIISKGRWENPLTAKCLERINVPFSLVIEPQELEKYSATVDPKKILQLPFSNLGMGSIPARNWVMDHSKKLGHDRHWIMDDNMRDFYRMHKNVKYRITSGTAFKVMEDFTDRYVNVRISGPQYYTFAHRKSKCKPVKFNTRVYSCILLSNKTTFRWRGRYNEDTDLSLRILKAGYCSILFNAFLVDKTVTMGMAGGNTDELYQQNEKMDGRWLMAESLRRQHPDVVEIKRKWGRWQHEVNYRPFKNNKLVRREDFTPSKTPDNYGMIFRKKK